MQHEELFCCHSAEWVEEVKKQWKATDNERKSECDRCAGNDGTDLYARAKETKKQNAKIKDEIAVELVEKLDYDFSIADKDNAMNYGVIARTIVLDQMVEAIFEEA